MSTKIALHFSASPIFSNLEDYFLETPKKIIYTLPLKVQGQVTWVPTNKFPSEYAKHLYRLKVGSFWKLPINLIGLKATHWNCIPNMGSITQIPASDSHSHSLLNDEIDLTRGFLKNFSVPLLPDKIEYRPLNHVLGTFPGHSPCSDQPVTCIDCICWIPLSIKNTT